MKSLFAQAATRGERILSLSRACICVAVAVRFVFVRGPELDVARSSHLLGVVPLSLVFLASIYMVWASRTRLLSQRELSFSVAVDALGAFLALLPNILSPWDGYRGVFGMPESTAIIIVAATAGFRVFAPVVMLGIALHATSLAVLATLDWVCWPQLAAHHVHNVSIFTVFFVIAAALAVSYGNRALRLAHTVADHAVEAERARVAVASLLREHHDLKGLLSAATLNAEMISRALGNPSQTHTAVPLAEDLHKDLLKLRELLTHKGRETYAALASLERLQDADLIVTVTAAIEAAQQRYPHVAFTNRTQSAEASVRFLGGSYGLERALMNLLVNAVEGDGTRGAKAVVVTVERSQKACVLCVEDDGPGFTAEALAAPLTQARTTKEHGSGVGLMLIQTLVHASGGRMERQNRAHGGAKVVFNLTPSS